MKLTIIIASAIIAMAGSASAQDAKETKVGAWTVRTISDPITDQSRVIAALDGSGGSLVVKCDSPGPNSVYIHFIAGEYLGEGRSGRREVIQRFDDAAPVTNQWTHDGRAAILTNNREVASFVRSLIGATRVAIRARTFQFQEVTALFDVNSADAEKAAKNVYDGCRDVWPAS